MNNLKQANSGDGSTVAQLQEMLRKGIVGGLDETSALIAGFNLDLMEAQHGPHKVTSVEVVKFSALFTDEDITTLCGLA